MSGWVVIQPEIRVNLGVTNKNVSQLVGYLVILPARLKLFGFCFSSLKSHAITRICFSVDQIAWELIFFFFFFGGGSYGLVAKL